MAIFFRTLLYTSVLCVVVWFLANSEQKQQIKYKYDGLITLIGRSSSMPVIANGQSSNSDGQSIQNSMEQINSCAKVESNTLAHKVVVYEWLDLDGNKQLSDTPPKQGYTNLHLKGLDVDNYFNLKLDSRAADLPAFTQSHIQSGVTKIYKTLIHVVKISELKAINLNLKFFSDKAQFHSYRQKIAPDTGFKTTGFYTSRLNEASVLAVGNKNHITSITLHESTHAIVAAMFGGAPVWLNEGLASFFDQMVITGEQTYKFSTDDRKFRLLRNSHLPTLRSHFSQSPQQWYADANNDLNYAVDWSLVFYMMINSQRRDFLRKMLEHLAVNDCHSFSTISYINQNYPGGVSSLEANWRVWLKNARSGTISF